MVRTRTGALLAELHAHTTWSDGALSAARARRPVRRARLRRPVHHRPRLPHGSRGRAGPESPPRASTPISPRSSTRRARARERYGLLVVPGLELSYNDPDPALLGACARGRAPQLRLRRRGHRRSDRDGRPGRRRADRGASVRRRAVAASGPADAALRARPRALSPRAPIRALQPNPALLLGRAGRASLRRERRLPPARASRRLEERDPLRPGRGGGVRHLRSRRPVFITRCARRAPRLGGSRRSHRRVLPERRSVAPIAAAIDAPASCLGTSIAPRPAIRQL